jgi:4'-phosphopantetheinyl transferase EntD
MIDRIIRPPATCAEAFDDAGQPPLYPEEWRIVERSVSKRQLEFTTGRACARRALGQLGIPAAPLLTGEGGAPAWPCGTVGSITHCRGYRAAVAARRRDVRAVGIDAEPNEPTPGRILEAIALPQEQRMVLVLKEFRPAVCWDRLLFCAKEAVFKAVFSSTGRRLGFDEAAVTFDPVHEAFSVTGTPAGAIARTFDGLARPATIRGSWLLGGGTLVAALVVLEQDHLGQGPVLSDTYQN